MEKITLTFVGRYTTDKNNQPLVSKKTNKPYTSLRIKCNEHGDKYLSGFDGAETKDWKIGDTVEVEITQNGDYLNFSVPKRNAPSGGGMSPEQFDRIYREVYATRQEMVMIRQLLQEKGVIPTANAVSANIPYPESKGPTAFDDPLEGIDPFEGMGVVRT